MSHVVFTAHDAGYQEMADITRPTLQRYADKHGYEFWYQNDIDEVEKDACKARIFLELYASGRYNENDIALWVDSDACVMNSDIPIPEPFYAAGGNPHFVWAYDWNGPNSGVWMARFTPQAAHFVRTYDYLARAMGWGDNWAMNQTMLLPPFKDWVKCISGRYMNSNLYYVHGIGDWPHADSINAYLSGDWILHLAGVPHEQRMELLRQAVKEAT